MTQDQKNKVYSQLRIFTVGAMLFGVGAYAFVADFSLGGTHFAGTIVASIGIGLMIRMMLAMLRTRREIKYGPQVPNLNKELRKLYWIVGYLVLSSALVLFVTYLMYETTDFAVGVICSVGMLSMLGIFTALLVKKRRELKP